MTDMRERVKAAIEKALYSEEAMSVDDELTAAADAAIAEAFKWMPIEDAPKNTAILVYWPFVDVFVQSKIYEKDNALLAEIGSLYFPMDSLDHKHSQRHYMTLPSPPTEDGK